MVYFVLVFFYFLLTWNFIDPQKSLAMGQKNVSTQKPAEHVANQVLVSLKSLPSKKERETLWNTWKLVEKEQIGESPLFLLEYTGKEKIDIPKLVIEIEKNSLVKYAEPNMIMKTFSNGS